MGRLWTDPAGAKTFFDDCALDVLNGHRRVRNPQDTGPFTGRWTYSPGELREIIGLMQTFEGLTPEATVHQIVPFRDQIIDRAARGHATEQRTGMAEWNATVHAAASLLLQLEHREMLMELVPIVHTFEW